MKLELFIKISFMVNRVKINTNDQTLNQSDKNCQENIRLSKLNHQLTLKKSLSIKKQKEDIGLHSKNDKGCHLSGISNYRNLQQPLISLE